MKNRILESLIASLLLCSLPIIAMEAEISSDEEDTVELEATDQSFFASQLAGAWELVSFGRSAAQSLLSHLTGTENSSSSSQDALFNLFFKKPEAFNQLVQTLPADVNKLVAQHVLRSHPLVIALKQAIPRCACTAAETGELQIQVKDHTGNIIAWHLNNEQSGTSRFLGRMGLMGGRANSVLPLTPQQNLGLRNMTLNRTGDKILISFVYDVPLIIESKTGKILHKVTRTKAKSSVRAALNNEGNGIAFCGLMTVKVFKLDQHPESLCSYREPLCILRDHTDVVTSLTFNTTGDSLLTASHDKTARIWNAHTGECIRVLQGHTDGVFSAKYNSADDRIITASKDTTARLWNAHTGECIHVLQADTDEISSAEFNRGGDKIATLSNAGIVIIWDSSSAKPLYSLPAAIRCTAHTGDEICHPLSVAFHDGALPDDIITFVNQHAGFKSWSVSVLNRLTNWLERECTLQQAMLLVAIYKYRIAPRVLKVRNQQAEQKLLDFIEYPHFEEQFAAMPAEMQHLLSRFVIRKTDEQTGC